MSALDAKLQIRPGQRIAILGSGPGLAIAAERAGAAVADAVIVFAKDRAELEPQLPMLADVVGRGGAAWLAYPKARQLGTDLNRDIIRDLVPAAGLDPVRQVSLDDIWSALRLKLVRH
jgi:D-arabinose 1-dehydrogenase-like Zn-dependent alcohol dehydrogenase